jgi:hypothetical protein
MRELCSPEFLSDLSHDALIVLAQGKLYSEDLFKEVEPKIELEGEL